MFSKKKTCAIPKEWLDRVTQILVLGKDDDIEWTDRASEEWHLYGKRWEAYEAIVQSLVVGVQGKFVKMPTDEGQTYAFFFLQQEANGCTVRFAWPVVRTN